MELNTIQLINKLNWFYSLELSQVDLYMAQSKQTNDIYLRKVFERSSYIEQQHVDNIAGKIKKLGGKPMVLGDVVAPVVGKIGGNMLSLTGVINTLKANIMLEQRAMADYKKLIAQIKNDPELSNLLWSNMIDEDLHTAWFSNKVRELESAFHS